MNAVRAIDWPRNLMIVFGLMKLLLVALFFASFAFVEVPHASAESSKSCNGKNLMAELQESNPDTYDQILSEASKTPNAEAIFWKVEKDGNEPSWLYGTMHMADPEIATIPDDAKNAILKSDSLVIETLGVLDKQASAKAMAGLAHLTLLKEGTLRDLIADELEADLEAAVTERGIPIQLADRMQPWLIATTVALPICEFTRKQSGEKVLDSALAEFAKQNGKSIKGLETVEEQLTALAGLPRDYHVSALEETLASGDLATDMIETMKVLYLSSQMGAVFPLMKAVMPVAGSGEGVAQFQEALIDERNHTMAERALPIIEKGSAFVAVGALHLPGDTGLVKLMREAGFTVTAVR